MSDTEFPEPEIDPIAIVEQIRAQNKANHPEAFKAAETTEEIPESSRWVGSTDDMPALYKTLLEADEIVWY
jgi:hypothetical protein